jgi:hypothetical protein
VEALQAAKRVAAITAQEPEKFCWPKMRNVAIGVALLGSMKRDPSSKKRRAR